MPQTLSLSARALAAGVMIRSGTDPIDPHAPDHERQRQAEFAEIGDRYKRHSMVDLCREALRMEGREVPEDHRDAVRSAMSSSNLSEIFTPNVNARLVTAYDEAEDSTHGWVEERDVVNFKDADDVSLGRGTGLTNHPRGSTAKHSDRESEKETYRISRYTEQLVVDEQDFIDDNLSALQRFPEEMGRAAARLRPDLVYGRLLANPTLRADSTAVFHADHANLATTGSALASATLQAGIVAMAKQTQDGVNLHIRPRFLIVPQDLAFTASELLNSTAIICPTDVERGNINTLQNLLKLRVDNRIGVAGVTDPVDGTHRVGTATNWFIASDPHRTVVVAYRIGSNRKPRIRSFTLSQGQWGIGWDISHDIGAAIVGYRGLYKATGAA